MFIENVELVDGVGRLMRTPGPLVWGLILFCRHAGVRFETAVEVGSYAGESSEILAQHCTRLLCVDPWSRVFYGLGEDAAAEPGPEGDFDTRMSRFLRSGRVSKLKMGSLEAAAIIAPQSLDLVYIDALHEEEPVTLDIQAWMPKVKPSGWIGGHDYDEGHPGVVAAVNNAFAGRQVLRFEDWSWLVRMEV